VRNALDPVRPDRIASRESELRPGTHRFPLGRSATVVSNWSMRSFPAILVLLVTLMIGGAMNLLHDCPERSMVAGAVECVACEGSACWDCDDAAGSTCGHAVGVPEDGDDAPVVVPTAAAQELDAPVPMTRPTPSIGVSAHVPDAAPRPPRA
jgi:hypothetical protein